MTINGVSLIFLCREFSELDHLSEAESLLLLSTVLTALARSSAATLFVPADLYRKYRQTSTTGSLGALITAKEKNDIPDHIPSLFLDDVEARCCVGVRTYNQADGRRDEDRVH